MSDAGLSVPDDIALAGFDDETWMHVVSPPLTAVRQPVEEMGLAAWARLMARVGGDTSPPQQVRLPCTMVVRASTAPASASSISAAAHSHAMATA